MGSVGDGLLEMPSLGRPFQLGMLYDIRREAIIPGVTLWSHNKIQNNRSVFPQCSTQMEISSSDSFEDKGKCMDIHGSFKISAMCGMIHVEGSGKYLNDTKTSCKQSRLTLKHHVTTQFEHLTMDHLASEQIDYSDVFEKDIATHVVTAMLYGADAYFVFDRELNEKDDKNQVEGAFKACFGKLGSVSVGSEVSLKMNEHEKAVTDKLSCTFYGDYKLSKNPSSFESAMQVYTELNTLLGENGEKAVPLRVWLYPLSKLNSKGANLLQEISNNLITCTSDAIECLNVVEMKCNDLAKGTAAQNFLAFREKIQAMRKICRSYKLDLMQEIGSLLPKIRGSGEAEKALVDLLTAHEQSPFSSTVLNQWLKFKEEESDVVKAFLEKLECRQDSKHKSVKIYQSHHFLLSNTENVVCYTFTSLNVPDNFLEYLAEYSRTKQKKVIRPETWLNVEVEQKMRKNLKLFSGLMSSDMADKPIYSVLSEHHEEHPGACTVVYGDDCDKALCFTPPSKPTCSITGAVTHDSLTLKLSPACEATVERRLEYKTRGEEKWKSQVFEKTKQEVTLTELKPDTEYTIRCVAVGKLGNLPVTSEEISSKLCKAVGPPTNLKATVITSSSVELYWDQPSFNKCGSIKEYIIEYKSKMESKWLKKTCTKRSFIIDGLKEDTSYCIRVFTSCGGSIIGEPAEETIFTKVGKNTS